MKKHIFKVPIILSIVAIFTFIIGGGIAFAASYWGEAYVWRVSPGVYGGAGFTKADYAAPWLSVTNTGWEVCWTQQMDWSVSNYQTNTAIVGVSGCGGYGGPLCGSYATLESHASCSAPGWVDYRIAYMAHPYRGWWP